MYKLQSNFLSLAISKRIKPGVHHVLRKYNFIRQKSAGIQTYPRYVFEVEKSLNTRGLISYSYSLHYNYM